MIRLSRVGVGSGMCLLFGAQILGADTPARTLSLGPLQYGQPKSVIVQMHGRHGASALTAKLTSVAEQQRKVPREGRGKKRRKCGGAFSYAHYVKPTYGMSHVTSTDATGRGRGASHRDSLVLPALAPACLRRSYAICGNVREVFSADATVTPAPSHEFSVQRARLALCDALRRAVEVSPLDEGRRVADRCQVVSDTIGSAIDFSSFSMPLWWLAQTTAVWSSSVHNTELRNGFCSRMPGLCCC